MFTDQDQASRRAYPVGTSPAARGLAFCLLTAFLLVRSGAGSWADDPVKPAASAKPPYQRLLHGDDARKAAGLNKRTGELTEADQCTEAIRAAEELLALRRHAQGDEHYEVVNVRWSLEALRKVAALPVKQRAEWRQALRSGLEAQRLMDQGLYAQALPPLQKRLTLCRQVLGEDHPDTANSYSWVAYNLHAKGKHAEAEPLLRKALAILHKALGEGHPDTASSYDNLAVSLDAQGRHAEAEPLLRKALAIRQQALGEGHPDTAQSYNNVAMNFHAQGRHAEAEPLMRKALAIRQQALGEDHPDTARSYNNVAVSLDAQGRRAEAEPLLRKALAIRQQALGDDHPETANSYNNVASNLDAQGRHAEAQPLARKALVIFQQALGEGHPDTANSYQSVAVNLHAQGKHAQAQAVLEKAVRSFEAARLRVSRAGLDRAVAMADRVSPWAQFAASRARDRQALPAWQALESHLGRGVLEEVAARQLAPLEPAERQEQADLSRQLDQLAPQILALVSRPAPTSEERGQLTQLLEERARRESALADLSARVARREIAELAAVQARLPADSALVVWLDVHDWSGAVQEHWACIVRQEGPPRWERLPGSGTAGTWTKHDGCLPVQVGTALARRSTGEYAALAGKLYAQRLAPVAQHLAGVKHLVIVPAGPMAGVPVEALTDRFTVSYAPSATLFTRLRQERPARTGTPRLFAVGDPLFRPPGKETPRPTPPGHGLYVSAVLPGGNAAASGLRGGDVLLRYGKQALTPSDDFTPATDGGPIPVQVWRDGQTLERTVQPGKLGVMLSKRPAAEEVRSKQEVERALERSARGKDYDPLPGTRREVAALAALFPERDVLLGADASEPALERLAREGRLKQYRYLHFATHGEVDRVSMRKCALVLSQEGLPDPLQQVEQGQKVYDGKLDAGEILDTWKLDADLVTLSACQTGLGQEGEGEGLMGFAQVLLSRGARSLVLSLWKVDDTATALLMVRFYENLLGARRGKPGGSPPLPKAEALREAKAWLRNLSREEAERQGQALPRGKGQPELPLLPAPPEPAPAPKDDKPYAHPYYWAAFILVGDPE
jgi:tetratricopeptide (TPR) repeat protein